jgi:hypothetical protein
MNMGMTRGPKCHIAMTKRRETPLGGVVDN